MRLIAFTLLALPALAGDPDVPSLIRQLNSDDAAQRETAQRALEAVGETAREPLHKALDGAGPELKARIERILRWTAAEWEIDAEAVAGEAYDREIGDWKRKSLAPVELAGDELAPIRGLFRMFRAEALDAHGVNARRDRLLVSKAGDVVFWIGEPVQQRALLERSRILAVDEAGVRRAGSICFAMTRTAWRTGEDEPFEPARLEVSGREAIYHEHTMTLLSGRIGTYREDDVCVFGEDGILEEVRSTGIADLTMEDEYRLLGEADPWLVLDGFVADETRDELEKAQAKKEKKPPRHEKK